MPILNSILDTDLYKLTMQNAVLNYRQGIPVQYVFNNRRPEGKFNSNFIEMFNEEFKEMANLKLSDDECSWLRSTLPWLGEDYIQYLKNYRYDLDEVLWEVQDGELNLSISGPWERTILWEVPLMALVSEVYFKTCDTDWKYDFEEQNDQLTLKATALAGKKFADFGTRRRRNYEIQDFVVRKLKSYRNFTGTSNVHLAYKNGVRPIGTMAHEWIMGISALESFRHANRCAMQIWSNIYKGNLGIALTDTFGTDAFFEDFDGVLARLFDGVRQDSGDPIEFIEKTINAYKKLRIDPKTKTVVFSDGLNVPMVTKIANAIGDRIQYSFGIGTNLTNDFGNSKPLNMVIKMAECNHIPVVKLSDTPSKAIGDPDALRVAKWTFFKTPLDHQN